MITNRMLLAGVVGLLVAALVACEERDSPQNFGLVQDADDHGDSSSEAMALDVGSTVDRDIEVIGGMDFFSFRAVGGQRYAIETQLGSLQNTTLTLYGGDGSSIAQDDDAVIGNASRIAWFAFAPPLSPGQVCQIPCSLSRGQLH